VKLAYFRTSFFDFLYSFVLSNTQLTDSSQQLSLMNALIAMTIASKRRDVIGVVTAK
jgi:hypothetical protein